MRPREHVPAARLHSPARRCRYGSGAATARLRPLHHQPHPQHRRRSQTQLALDPRDHAAPASRPATSRSGQRSAHILVVPPGRHRQPPQPRPQRASAVDGFPSATSAPATPSLRRQAVHCSGAFRRLSVSAGFRGFGTPKAHFPPRDCREPYVLRNGCGVLPRSGFGSRHEPRPRVERVPSSVAARMTGGEVGAVVGAAIDTTNQMISNESIVVSFGEMA